LNLKIGGTKFARVGDILAAYVLSTLLDLAGDREQRPQFF
jgi:hypothetical protein